MTDRPRGGPERPYWIDMEWANRRDAQAAGELASPPVSRTIPAPPTEGDPMTHPRRPEDTTQRDPLLHLALALGEGSGDAYIKGMEAAGQDQIVHSDTLPSDSPWTELEALGFVRGDVIAEDPIFNYCSLPEGWKRVGSDHPMWSHVVDERGVKRVNVFYKAAFYDRSAHASIADPGRELASHAVYGDSEPTALPAEWAVLTDSERARFLAVLREYLRKASESPTIYGEQAAYARVLLRLAGAQA